MSNRQDNTKLSVILKLAAVLMFAVACLLFPTSFLGINDHIAKGIVRIVFAGLGVALMVVFGFGKHLTLTSVNRYSLIVISAVLLVSIFNFPFLPLLTNNASLSATASDVFIYLFFNAAVALFEEIFFRGLVLLLLFELFRQLALNNKGEISSFRSLILPIVISAALFSLIHLLNTPIDVMQLGYTFLLGLIWGYLVFTTKTIWFAVAAHFIFNLGGTMLTHLGQGIFFTTGQIIITAIVGTLCGIALIAVEIRRLKSTALK